jgi:shikimate dehydrogenase
MNQNKFNLDTKIIGLFGHPIRHSYSPFMHNITFELLSLNYIYLPFDVPITNFKDAVKGIVALGIKGFNVTIPHKENIIPFLKNVSEEASIIGAVNTVVNDNGVLSGFNTDVTGIIETLLPFKDEILNEEVSILGAGGAARSAIYALIRHFKPGRINIINRTEQKSESLKDYFKTRMHFNQLKSVQLFTPDLTDILKNSKLIINTTSVGMSPNVDDSVINELQAFTKDQIVFDIVYNPVKTKFLQTAQNSGAKTINGLKMFVHQGAKSFELWTGVQMPVDKIFRALQLHITES